VTFGRDTSWRDIGRDLAERARDQRQREAQAKLNPSGLADSLDTGGVTTPQVTETSEVWGMPDDPIQVEANGVQIFRFVPNASPRAHQLTVVMNSTAMFAAIEQMATHLRARTPGPCQLTFVGNMTAETFEETEADNADDPGHDTPT
jgi:hypothetical protein